jgi:hypothetical protein
VSVLADRLLAVHRALDDAGLPHAFGGAIALAYCTEEPRGTRDVDVNVFVGTEHADAVLAALPRGVAVTPADADAARRDGQVRVWWDDTPLDVFFDVHDFHQEVAAAVHEVPFAGAAIPVLDCLALVVFKALYNRTKDWADIEAMAEATTFDVHGALAWVVRLGGPDHPAVSRLASLPST